MKQLNVIVWTPLFLVFLGLTANVASASAHSGVTQIYSGSDSNYTCALFADERLHCWGTNNSLGPSSYASQEFPKPRSVSILKVSTGNGFACALYSDFTVWCWGSNDKGQLGDGTITDRVNPVQVRYDALDVFRDAVDIASGGSHACAVRLDGTVWCWGANSYGQLGNFNLSTTTVSVNPIQVVVYYPAQHNPILSSVQSISAGAYTTCALFDPDPAGSTGACWGNNTAGQLGNGIISGAESSPLTIFVAPSTQLHMTPYSIHAGNFHTCAMIPDSTLGCWGDNYSGATSTKISGDYPWPATVYNGSVRLTTATSLTTGGNSTCALLNDQTAACWGENSSGQIGHYKSFRADAFAPYPVINADGSTLRNIASLVAGAAHACALTSDQQVSCWGSNGRGQLGQSMFVADTDVPTQVPVDAPLFTDNFEQN